MYDLELECFAEGCGWRGKNGDFRKHYVKCEFKEKEEFEGVDVIEIEKLEEMDRERKERREREKIKRREKMRMK